MAPHFAIALITVLLCLNSCTRQGAPFGTVTSITGTAEYKRMGSASWLPCKPSKKVLFGDSIRTSDESDIVITFDQNTISLGEKTIICLRDTVDSLSHPCISIFTASGEVLSDINKLTSRHPSFEVRTPNAVAAIRGTSFHVRYDRTKRRSGVSVLRGKVLVFNPLIPRRPIFVMPGEMTVVALRGIPLAPTPLNYGEFKKFSHLMRPEQYRHFIKKHKIDERHMSPMMPLMVPGLPHPSRARNRLVPGAAVTPMGPAPMPGMPGMARRVGPPLPGPGPHAPMPPVPGLAPRGAKFPSPLPMAPGPHLKGKRNQDDDDKRKVRKK